MWTKQPETKSPEPRSAQDSSPSYSSPIAAPPATTSTRLSTPTARNMSCLGPGLHIKGEIHGSEDLQIDAKVDGPISLQGQRLTVGPTGRLSSEVTAREVIVHGEITGNLQTQDRVEIKKDASVIGDIRASRISVEDGAYFKGRIEIDRGKRAGSSAVSTPVSTPAVAETHHDVPALVGSETN
jgi:cytoskeletal protein CcmA (bactofilin family)